MAPIFEDIHEFYFGDTNDIQVEPYIRLTSYMNLVYPMHKEIAIQALSKSKAEIKILRFNIDKIVNGSIKDKQSNFFFLQNKSKNRIESIHTPS